MHPLSLIAHRGSPLRAPENTAISFERALQLGAREVEGDIQLTADGVAVLCHDDTLARYGHGELTVGGLSFAELAELDFGAWHAPEFAGERIFPLEALLTRYGNTVSYHLELKDQHADTAKTTLQALAAARLTATLTSFRPEQLERVRALTTEQPLGWLVKEVTEATWEQARALRLTQMCPKADLVTEALMCRAAEAGVSVRPWGCPRTAEAARATVARLRQLGCVGITVDELEWFAEPLATPAA